MSLPSLNSLRAFETVARHKSASRAAEELGVTQPAVTQQVRLLEGHLGLPMVRREGQGLSLTAEGRALAARLAEPFAEIADAVAEAIGRQRGAGVLTVTLLPTFAQRWLIPRLTSFQAAHPEIEVRLSATARLCDLVREDVDLAIRFGNGRWPGCDSRPLMTNDMFPVINPHLAESKPLRDPADLAGHVWLQVEAEPRTGDWDAWLTAAGVAGIEPAGWLSFEASSHALAAATAGLGIAIGHRPFVIDDLAAGRLARPFETVVESGEAYYLVTAKSRTRPAAVTAFADWLMAEAT